MSAFNRLRLLAAVASLGVCGIASAASVPLTDPVTHQYSGWTANWDSSLDAFVSVVTDGLSGNAVFIQKFAEFTGPPPGGLSPITITFQQTQPTTITNIVIEDEAITNGTGVPWTDFHMDITDSGDAHFDPTATAGSGGPGPIGFNINPFTTAAFGTSASGPNTTLDLGGGTVPAGTIWTPGNGPSGDGQLWMSVSPHAAAPFTVFTLKERPTVPEPTTLGALAIGGLALLRRRK